MASRAFGNTALFWHWFLQALWAVSASPDFEAIVSLTWDCCSSVTQLVVSDSLLPRGLQHARFPCSSLSLRACSNSCPLSQWCHPTISSSVVPFSSCLQSFPASGSFPMSRLFRSGGQSINCYVHSNKLSSSVWDYQVLTLTVLYPRYALCAGKRRQDFWTDKLPSSLVGPEIEEWTNSHGITEAGESCKL